LAGAVLWAVLVSVTNYKIGYAAVGVGALVGLAAGRTKVSFLDVLTSRHLPAVYQNLFRPLDALFYVLAPVTAFRFTTSQQAKTGTLWG